MQAALTRFFIFLMIAVVFTGGGRVVAAAMEDHAAPLEHAYAAAGGHHGCSEQDCQPSDDTHHDCVHAHVHCCGALAFMVSDIGPADFHWCDHSAPFDPGSAVPLNHLSYLPQRPPSAAA